MTNIRYRRTRHQMEVGYALAPSPFGRVLVAGTARGVSAVYLGDTNKSLATALRREYPSAKARGGPAQISLWTKRLVRCLSGVQQAAELPLDVKGTTFQRRVWKALREIPFGTTKTYAEISRAIGQPKAARAVARACATNPVAVVIPCHRVVRADGKLGGYRWGIERKQALLEHERSGGRREKHNDPRP